MDKTQTAEAKEEVVRNPNEIRDLIYTCLSLTEYTKVPILFLGNPGIAKTTGVRTWAAAHNYRVTTLIGTQRVAEEILGYMVNDTGEKRLITYTPDWYDEIAENAKAGFKTLLFIDELSQAPDNVQGEMLQLIFDRKVGGRANFLPEDCLVVSAANYKGNIPPQCGLQAPTLNRFCIINVMPQDGIGLVDEFLQSPEEMVAKIPVFQNTPISPKIEASARKILRENLNYLFQTYGMADNAKDGASLDIRNTNFSDIFDQPGEIYNFLTGRTIHYMYKMALGLIHYGLVRKVNKSIVHAVCKGLGGLGTNTFHSDKERSDFELALITGFQKVLRKSVEENMNEINATELNFKGKALDKCISDWMRHQESNGNINDANLHKLVALIEKEYDPSAAGMTTNIVNNFNSTKFLTDMQKIDTLHNYIKNAQLVDIAPIVKKLSIIIAAYDAYKVAVLSNLVKRLIIS